MRPDWLDYRQLAILKKSPILDYKRAYEKLILKLLLQLNPGSVRLTKKHN